MNAWGYCFIMRGCLSRAEALYKLQNNILQLQRTKTLAAPLGMDLPLAQELKSVVCSNQTPTGNHTSTSFLSFLSTSFMTAPANVQQRQMTPRA